MQRGHLQMLRKLQQLRKKEQGFTIIEVLIVLAIAALILVIVLVAIPQLQRNQRNTERQSKLQRMVTEVNNYAGSNEGRLPNAAAAITPQATAQRNLGRAYGAAGGNFSWFARYMGCPNPAVTTVDQNSCTVNFVDPRTARPMGSGRLGSNDFSLRYNVDLATIADATGGTPDSTNTTAIPGDLSYSTGRICDGETSTATGANDRNFTLQTRLEGGSTYCLDNQ